MGTELDLEWWRYLFAGIALNQILQEGFPSVTGLQKDMALAVHLADALLAELEKEKK